MASQSQAELIKIGNEGFAIIDKYFNQPRSSGRLYYSPPRYQYGSQVAQMKEPINNSKVQSSNIAGHTNFRGIYSEVKFL